jgi:hypothetical protein
MLASTRGNQRRTRRGVILILVLGMLALMAVIGVTFATFSGQARIGSRNFAQSVNQSQRDELMDFALAQLISDTADIRSAIRGHSMARDMYGNDGRFNGYLTGRPGGIGPAPFNYSTFYITNVATVAGFPTLYDLTTNIPQNDPAFYGYHFTRWTLRVAYNGTLNTGVTGAINQSLEVIVDNGYNANSNNPRILRVNINPLDSSTALNNLTSGTNTQLPGIYLVAAAANGTNLGTTTPFILDGRWLHAFNGPGQGANAVRGNFRFSGLLPAAQGMDEDYDAADLENWFLALQSADGSVMIPSFHRPAAIRVDLNNKTSDWSRDTVNGWTFDMARILRPVAADGHDATTFPDLLPDSTGRLQFDVDNDGDGQTDSVWVDLGYTPRRNAQGQLYKPLFAFMVIGLNGRIPLNTAGNLAGGGGPAGGASHAAHLGNSVSEVDPTYGLQNGFDNSGTSVDATLAFTAPAYDPTTNSIIYAGNNSQHDSGDLDVRLTQLRNLLAGTRPQLNPTPSSPLGYPQYTDQTGLNYGDDNFVMINSLNGSVYQPYFMPNGRADATDRDINGAIPPAAAVQNTRPSVPGRWGEAQSVPGYPMLNPATGIVMNQLGPAYNDRIRAGYSLDPGDVLNDVPRDAADDNFNAFDPFPIGHTGEVGDADYYDAAGALLLPVERMRRYVTPADVNGTGRVFQWNGATAAPMDLGNDQWGRVQFFSYYRPPGLPGWVEPSSGAAPGTVQFSQWTSGFVYPTSIVSNSPTLTTPAPNLYHNNNPLHGFLSWLYPNLTYGGPFTPQRVGGAPFDLNANPNNANVPGTLPTYDFHVNSAAATRSDALNEADEMNLYQPNAQLDSPFSFSDLEWLYRKQDVDGASLNSRLSQLAPISFTNTIDGQRRRRLYSIDTWETNNYAWANDNPSNAFPTNSTFTPINRDASYQNWSPQPVVTPPPGMPAPTVVHRDKKINLNAPLPVSNDPNEPIRQKWITDTYYTLKSILPPKAVDTAEELAQLSQYVINIVDFRDPDCTMTHWVNPDVWFRPALTTTVSPTVVLTANKTATDLPLSQYGMEYNPVAINEVLAYSFARKLAATATATPRFFIELVNTLTAPELGVPAPPGGLGTATNNASILDLAGFQSGTPGLVTPWDGGCWDLLFTADNSQSRPDPITGQLWYGGTYYALTPFSTTVFGATTDPIIYPLPQSPGPTTANFFTGDPTKTPVAPSYFMTVGNTLPNGDGTPPAPELTPYTPNYTLTTTYDPFSGTPPWAGGGMTLPLGVLPQPTTGTAPAPAVIPTPVQGSGTATFYWVCLRRPANPFAPVSATNPMMVVDCMRFPMIESGGTGVTAGGKDTVTQGANYMYSYQRYQPFRGGQAVPVPGGVASALDTRYGYSEQMVVPTTMANNGLYGQAATQAGPPGPNISSVGIFHTLGATNDLTLNIGTTPPSLYEPWDYVPFNDRDFTSVAELMLVPGCPPGLFTKQFAEFAPTSANVTTIFSTVTSLTTPQKTPKPGQYTTATTAFNATATAPVPPHTFPYLIDKFFYTGYGATGSTDTGGLVDGYASDGWFKMFEFFEVPSQMIGAVGPVAQGMNFDWARQDSKPGLINPNLIVDEEVFFSVFGKQPGTPAAGGFDQQLLNFNQLSNSVFGGASWGATGSATPFPLAAGASPLPMVVTSTRADGSPGSAYPMNNVGVVAKDPILSMAGVTTYGNRMKAAFAQFLTLRHGGSGFVFGFGDPTIAVGQNYAFLNSANVNSPATPSGIPPDRPFHSLSFPDIDYTIMRPAALPPSNYTDPKPVVPTGAGAGLPPAYVGGYSGDPGVRNSYLYPALATGSTPGSAPTGVLVPPAIPLRRLFQPPDANPSAGTSNASEIGDPYLNSQTPIGTPPPLALAGALPPYNVAGAPYNVTSSVNMAVANLFWAGVPTLTPPLLNPYLGANTVAGPPVSLDQKQHPYFRTELLQKAMNLTTVRTHQYAVWITIGFFEVKRKGDLGEYSTSPALAFDILGPEVGASTGQTTRYRGFFVVDRLQLTGFDPNTPGAFRPAVLYRQDIE